MEKPQVALRIDDIFASSKQFEVYGRETFVAFGRTWPISLLSNFLFMKYVPGFSKRLPYREMSVAEWEDIFELLRAHEAKMTIGITATWVERDGSKTPFFEKFPRQAVALKQALQAGLIEVANHGLTHCVEGKHRIRPFASNRIFHREFWKWIPADVQRQHLRQSQDLLAKFFGCEIVTLIPPGNVWCEETEVFAAQYGIRYLSSREAIFPTGKVRNGLTYIGDQNVIAFHDQEVVRYGLGWFENVLKENRDKKIVAVKDLSIKTELCTRA